MNNGNICFFIWFGNKREGRGSWEWALEEAHSCCASMSVARQEAHHLLFLSFVHLLSLNTFFLVIALGFFPVPPRDASCTPTRPILITLNCLGVLKRPGGTSRETVCVACNQLITRQSFSLKCVSTINDHWRLTVEVH